MKYDIDTLYLSDVHLGSKGCNAKEVLKTLKNYNAKNLVLVGDFIDGWLLQRRMYWPQSHNNVIQYVLKLSKKGTKVIYVTGNHDEFLRSYSGEQFGDIEIVDEYIEGSIWTTHGDLYDGIVKLHWLGKLGGRGYELSIMLDRWMKRMGFRVSLSKWLKSKVKEAVKFVTNFENALAKEALERGCDTVLCGHIHTPSDKIIENGVRYLNCGDWIENNSYIVKTLEGQFELRYYGNSVI